MNKGYWLASYRTVSPHSDTPSLEAYRHLAEQAIAGQGGVILIRTAQAIGMPEAGLKQHTIIVEFASVELARVAYASEHYQAALKQLGAHHERDVDIVEGHAQRT